MKKTRIILFVLALVGISVSLIACNTNTVEHVHKYSTKNRTHDYLLSEATCMDPAVYYKNCYCGEKSSETFDFGEVDFKNHINCAPYEYTSTDDVRHLVTNFCSDCNATINIVEDHEFNLSNVCDKCNYTKTETEAEAEGDKSDLSAGLYATGTNNLLKSWSTLISEGTLSSDGTVVKGKEQNLVGDIIIPNSVISIPVRAFYNCSRLTSIYIPDGVTSIGFQAFWCCSSITEVTIPDSVKSIGFEAFKTCAKLKHVILPQKLNIIQYSTFEGCEQLVSVEISHTVKEIGDNAFKNCEKLTDIYYRGSQYQWNNIAFYQYWKEGTELSAVHCADGDIVVGQK